MQAVAATTDPYGPLVGPSDEYLCDGGDYVTPAGVQADWTIQGLEQEDAISHYDTADGRVLVTPSNRVCIYAPRFAAVRRVVQPIAHEQPVFVNATLEELSPAKAVDCAAGRIAEAAARGGRSTLASSRPACSASGNRPAGWRICKRRWMPSPRSPPTRT